MNPVPCRIAISAGEASGDLLASRLITAIHKRHPNIQFHGLTGPKMEAAGCQPIVKLDDTDVMGFYQVLLKLPRLIGMRHRLLQHFTQYPPDLFIGVDFTDFNLRLAAKLKKNDVKTIQYKGPSVWAWRSGRVKTLKKYIDLLFTIFPFEQAFYEKSSANTRYVGHQLAHDIPLTPDITACRQRLALPTVSTPLIAILPGSRRQEILSLAHTFVEAAKRLQHTMGATFLIAHLNEKNKSIFRQALGHHLTSLSSHEFTGRTQEVLAACDAAMVVSGTATLEAMLYKKPMVVAYKLPKLYPFILRRLVKVKYIALPNLLADRLLVPELIQEAATPDGIAKALQPLLEPTKVAQLQQDFLAIHEQLRCNTEERIVDAVMEMLAMRQA